MAKYTKQNLHYVNMNGSAGANKTAVVASNGKAIAECNTVYMADKIIKGLELLAEEECKMKMFKV